MGRGGELYEVQPLTLICLIALLTDFTGSYILLCQLLPLNMKQPLYGIAVSVIR